MKSSSFSVAISTRGQPPVEDLRPELERARQELSTCIACVVTTGRFHRRGATDPWGSPMM